MYSTPIVKVLFDRGKTASLVTKGSLEIEIYYKRKRKRVMLPIRLLKTQWKKDMVVNHPLEDRYNLFLITVLEELRVLICKMSVSQNFDLERLADVVKSQLYKSNNSFLSFLKERIESRLIEESTRKQHRIVYNRLVLYGKLTEFSDLTLPNIKRFDDWLHTQGICQNTVHTYHKRLKPYVRDAMELGYITVNPYSNLRIPVGKSDTILYLLDDERMRIERLELTGTTSLVRDIFVFCTYTGLAFCDAMKIRKTDFVTDDGKVKLIDKRKKSKSPYKLTILKKAQDILEKYDYHFPGICNQTANNHLKIIREKAMIHHGLTSHMARHTFATWALKSGVPIEVVSKMLAHKSIKQTMTYAHVLQLSVDAGFEHLANFTPE